MKRWLSACLVVLLAMCLLACSGKEKEPVGKITEAAAESTGEENADSDMDGAYTEEQYAMLMELGFTEEDLREMSQEEVTMKLEEMGIEGIGGLQELEQQKPEQPETEEKEPETQKVYTVDDINAGGRYYITGRYYGSLFYLVYFENGQMVKVVDYFGEKGNLEGEAPVYEGDSLKDTWLTGMTAEEVVADFESIPYEVSIYEWKE